MTRPSVKQLLTRTSGLMAARIAGGAAALIANLLIARHFGAETLGIFALALAAVSLAAVVLPAGFQAVGVMFTSQYLTRNRPGLVGAFARRGYCNILTLTGLGTAALGGVALIGGQAAFGGHAASAVFAAATAPALAVINFNGSLLNGYRRPFSAMLPDLLFKPLAMILAIFAVVELAGTGSLNALLAAVCLAFWASALVQAGLMRQLKMPKPKPPPKREPRRWRKAALPWMTIAILSDYFIELHLLLAGFLVAPAQVAVLHICFRLRVLAAFGLRALYALILPDLFASYERKDWSELRGNILRANGFALIYALGVCLAIWPLGAWVLGLFGDSFAQARGLLLVVCSAMITRAAFGPAPAIMAMNGDHGAAIRIPVAGAALALGLGIALAPQFGIMAVAVAYSLSYSGIAIAQWWRVKRRTGIDCSIFAGLTGRRVRAGLRRLLSGRIMPGQSQTP
jgi:O-antigen/teichoic acid export membrane protein